jgi:mRNA interferase YafQ
MLSFRTTNRFRKDVRHIQKRGLDLSLLDEVVQTLLEEKPLAIKHRDHALTGEYLGLRECHIQPNWLLIYEVNKAQLILTPRNC